MLAIFFIIVSKQIASYTLPVTREVYNCRFYLYLMNWSFKRRNFNLKWKVVRDMTQMYVDCGDAVPLISVRISKTRDKSSIPCHVLAKAMEDWMHLPVIN